MKKYFSTFFVASLLIIGLSVNAQSKSQKFGHINSQELLAAMPESDSAQKQVEKLAKEHQSVIEEMTVEYNKKVEDLTKVYETLSDLAKASKEAELQDMQTRIQTFQQKAQDDLQQKRAELFKPIQDKALGAVNAVASENGFTYILDSGVGAVVYEGPDAIDILPLVKKKLGLQ
jgi:outer membrane protein